MLAIATIAALGFTDYMLIDIDPADGSWEPMETCNDGSPMVYDTLSEAEQAMEEVA